MFRCMCYHPIDETVWRDSWLPLRVRCAAGLAREERDALTRARTLYNQRQFEAAIAAAEQARQAPARVDSADLIAARAYLELLP